ncbi:ATP-binding protein [Neolewinella antarctica]|uniref:ATP-dependent DNA helicase RecG n=1 Tax=Neolewinella antarctica TaxID=442734 RepID=A0ABX0XD82_9BACT|nr:ATP-binding protein [Neolewinella antarctica]NJC27035.1 ATP-dependent DNA helicase RecG [Neolewinella antarctica]
MTAKEILTLLNATDELETVEAKRASKMGKSIAETICAYTNTGGITEGYILAGVVREESLFPSYTVVGVPDSDAFQMDVASQCATLFNRPIHPRVTAEQISGKTVVLITVAEADATRKPLYFKKGGLPGGAWIRVGSTDQRCTEEDLEQFYGDRDHFDGSFLDRTSMKDVDEEAVRAYRRLRSSANADAIELTYSDEELLLSLDCLADDESGRLTVAGLLLFGKASTLRRKFPMQRVDYIRVTGNRWDPNPYDRFRSIDMRGPLLLMAFRAVEAIDNDLPKQFRLSEGQLQAQALTIPGLALREAVVNALMHRNYRISGATQIVRYNNRVEIVNPGFSLKPEAQLGEKGSRTRNPRIAAVFHETNLAEAKGSGIQVMRRLLREADFSQPTFTSDRERNEFTVRMLLHHFLNEEDLAWLAQFEAYDLSAEQKFALIFMREVGAINNSTYRQLVDGDLIQAGQDLHHLRKLELIEKKGKTRGTYYVPNFQSAATEASSDGQSGPPVEGSAAEVNPRVTLRQKSAASVQGNGTSVQGRDTSVQGENTGVQADPIDRQENKATVQVGALSVQEQLPKELKQRVELLGKRADRTILTDLVVDLCAWKDLTLQELTEITGRQRTGLVTNYITPLMEAGRIVHTIPDMKKHPDQAYRTVRE